MTTRVIFDRELLRAVQVRGLTVCDLAQRARLSPATVSAAIRGKALNVRSAVTLARAVSA
jgi:transcriptional regulator with XRE-family HTH domain